MTDTQTDLTIHERAKKWRVDNRYTREEISRLTGFSVSVIADLETGFVRGNHARPVPVSTMKRYRLCLAAVAHKLEGWDFA
jgi:transcriptional regulator with XRE-family HTH domain